jgi:S-adenosylmethionine:tRNA-ribosyltransferase-isomerase (queuine synthetase)
LLLICLLSNEQQIIKNYKDAHHNKWQNYFFGCSLSWVSS